MTSVKTETVAADEGGTRVDRWFKRRYPGLGHGALEKLLRTGQVRVDGGRAKASDRLAVGASVRIPPMPDTASETPVRETHADLKQDEKIAAEDLVIHMDSEIIILNKPPGLASQGGPGITRSVDHLLGALSYGKKQRPRLVHRLDKDTSGVLVIARTVPAAAALSEAFRERDTKKVYWALTVGVPKPHQGIVKAALAKVPHGPGRSDERMVIRDLKDDEDAKRAVTRYQVVDHAAQKAAWVAMMPVTGRTHQLRVHATSLGTPIAGDFKYGEEGARLSGALSQKMHLHARYLRIRKPSGGYLEITAPLPPHMAKSWAMFGWNPDDATDFFPDA
jgi:23S rRNA pseudouridine955/2504/2580 synthase